MKNIITKSYTEAQQQTVSFDPKRLKTPMPNQNDLRVRNFQQAFVSLSLPGMSNISQPDAMVLIQIDTEIRKKLRDLGFTRLAF